MRKKRPIKGRFFLIMNIISSLLLFLGWVQPHHVPPWISWYSELMVLLAVLSISLSTAIGHLKIKTIGSSRFLIFPAIFIILPIIQYWAGIIDYFGTAAVHAIYAAGATLAMYVAYKQKDPREFLKRISLVTVSAAGISIVTSYIQALGIDVDAGLVNQMPQTRRPGANMGQPNHLATLILMALAGVYYLWKIEVISAVMLFIALFIGLSGVAITESKTALFSVVLMTIFVIKQFPEDGSLKRIIYPVVAICFTSLCWGLWPIFYNIYWSSGAGGAGNRLAVVDENIRLLLWSQLIDAISSRPWFGWGSGGIAYAIHSVVGKYEATAPFTYAHNLALDLAVSYGLPVAVIAVVLTAYWCHARLFSRLTLVAKCSTLMAIPIITHSLFEFPHAYSYFLFPFALLIGVIETQGVSKSLFYFRAEWEKLVLIVSVVVGVLVIRDYWSLEEDFRIARFEHMRVGVTETGYVPPKPYILTNIAEINAVLRFEPRPNMEESQIRRAERISLHYPWVVLQNKYAQILFLNDYTEQAKTQLRLIEKMHGKQKFEMLKVNWIEFGEQHQRDVAVLFND
ncbi:Virulence factor membrane-bound polymerase, C-terminal [Comamonadaceae bacterium]